MIPGAAVTSTTGSCRNILVLSCLDCGQQQGLAVAPASTFAASAAALLASFRGICCVDIVSRFKSDHFKAESGLLEAGRQGVPGDVSNPNLPLTKEGAEQS